MRSLSDPSQVLLFALLNGSAVGSQFLLDNTTSHTRPTRLPEGPNQITGHVTDGFGRRSESVTTPFVIDTLAPQFVDLTPPSGSIFSAAQITLQGSVDDPAAKVRLAGNPDVTGPTFNFPMTLSLGTSVLTLTATDPAGNGATQILTYVYEPPNALPSVSITNPANGASFVSPATITVSAQAADSEGSITKVDFFGNGTSIGAATSAPYAMNFTAGDGARPYASGTSMARPSNTYPRTGI